MDTKLAKPLKVGYERFALMRVTYAADPAKGLMSYCADLFEPKTLMIDTVDEPMFRNGTIVLLNNNGTQVNFDAETKLGEWEHLRGLSAGPKLLGYTTPELDKWQTFIDRCHFLDIKDDEIWGLGKWGKRGRLWEKTIVVRLRERYGEPNNR